MTHAKRVLPERIHTEVERAIAFGRSDAWISEHIGLTADGHSTLTAEDVELVGAYMDQVIDEDDHNGRRAQAKRVRKVFEHGTGGAYEQHVRDRERACDVCLAWNANRVRARRAARPLKAAG